MAAVDSHGNAFLAPAGNRVAKYAAHDGHLLWEAPLAEADGPNTRVSAYSVDAAGDLLVSGLVILKQVPGLPSITIAPLFTAKYAGEDGHLLWQSVEPPAPWFRGYVADQAVDRAGDLVLAFVSDSNVRILKYAGSDGGHRWVQSIDGYGPIGGLAITSRGDVGMASYGTGRQAIVRLFAGETGALLGEHRTTAAEGVFGEYVPYISAGPNGTVAVGATSSGNAVTYVLEPTSDAPVVTVLGDVSPTLDSTQSYVEAGATASDGIDGSLSTTIGSQRLPLAPNDLTGVYPINYTAVNSRGIIGGATRFVRLVKSSILTVTAQDLAVEANGTGGAMPYYLYDVKVTNGGVGLKLTFDPPEATLMPVGTTKVRVTADDGSGHVGTATFNVTVRDTVAPMISGEFSPLAFTGSELPDYRPQASVWDLTQFTLTQIPAPHSAVIPGRNVVTITATDEGRNQASVSFEVEARLNAPVRSVPLRAGDLAPGAGEPGGPPAGATLMAFGVPAIDGAGELAFTARWKKGTRSGLGIFTRERCVALEGEGYQALADPVIDEGHVAFLGTRMDGTAAVWSEAQQGTLEVLAQAGQAAPGIDGAKFRSFQAVAITGGAVAIKAKASGDAGKVVTGVWVCDATHGLQALLYEGQQMEGARIERLETLVAGADSPGQGRGWLETASGATRVLARALNSHRAQLFVSAAFGESPQVLAETGVGRGFAQPAFFPAPGQTDFRVLGLPVLNELGALAFLGEVGVPVRRGLGLLTDPAAHVLASQQAVGRLDEFSHTSFRTLGEPVLAAGDIGMAFQATTNDGAPGHPARRAIWWQRPHEFAESLAALGSEARGLPGRHWKSIDSLAIMSGRGPLFRAKTEGGEQGVWAVDVDGTLRLLFRTGEKIEGKLVRQFTLLNALPGSSGSTRSFNARGQVAWRAMLGGGEQALVVTQAP